MDLEIKHYLIIRYDLRTGDASVTKDVRCSDKLAKRLCQKYQTLSENLKTPDIVYFPHQLSTSLVGEDGLTLLGGLA